MTTRKNKYDLLKSMTKIMTIEKIIYITLLEMLLGPGDNSLLSCLHVGFELYRGINIKLYRSTLTQPIQLNVLSTSTLTL
jgi:hypothetical protein